jgi:putative flippase GtrA
MKPNFKGDALTQKIRFVAVGFFGFVMNYSILSIAVSLNMHQVSGEILAAIVALQATFFLHDKWTYLDKATPLSLPLHSRYALYITSNSFGSIMTVLIFSVVAQFIPIHLISLGMAAFAAMVWNYVVNKVVIWRHAAQQTEE